jgi:Zn-dependent protease
MGKITRSKTPKNNKPTKMNKPLVILFALNLQSQLLIDMAYFGIAINLILGVFNLLPLPPLDVVQKHLKTINPLK